MRRLLLKIRYNGGAYHGWQVQKNAVSVQTVLQNAMERVLGERPDVHGCSRTDSGVHALEYFAHFDTANTIPCNGLVYALNRELPDDIAAVDCCEVSADFHARYSCTGKRYDYRIYTGKLRDPFREGLCWHYPHALDAGRMNEAANAFVGRHDFSGFCSTGGKTEDNVRTVTEAVVRTDGAETVISISADGFLYNMVRIMVGTLVYVSEGKIEPSDMPAIIKSGDRKRAGITAPACGLYLHSVRYEGSEKDG